MGEATSLGGAGAVDESEVERLALTDREVRKLVKALREICKLEYLSLLEPLQAAKVARKSELEVELDSVLGLAKARARNDLRQGPSAWASPFSFYLVVASLQGGASVRASR